MSKGDEIRERVFRFVCDIVRLHDELVTSGAGTRDMSRQMLRSATSIGANLEEADAGQSKADFISKCNIALKEARETLYWLRILQATNRAGDASLPLITECDRIVAVLTTIVRKAKGEGQQ